MVSEVGKAPADQYWTKDRWLAIILLTLGHEVIGVDCDEGIATFKFSREDIEKHLGEWFANKKMPIEDVRQFILGEQLFNSYTRHASLSANRRP